VNVGDVKYIVVENGNTRQLQVTSVSAADEGVYSCRVQNKQSMAKLLVARAFFYIRLPYIYKQLHATVFKFLATVSVHLCGCPSVCLPVCLSFVTSV